jgi:hypothetical protein
LDTIVNPIVSKVFVCGEPPLEDPVDGGLGEGVVP